MHWSLHGILATWGWQDLKFWRAHPWIDASMGSNGINWWWRGVRGKNLDGTRYQCRIWLPNAASTYVCFLYALEHHSSDHFASTGDELHVLPCRAHAATGSPSSSSPGARCRPCWPHSLDSHSIAPRPKWDESDPSFLADRHVPHGMQDQPIPPRP
jgi:hypothetical protein